MDVIRQKLVVTRKAHVCSGCWETYEKGTKMVCSVVADGGEIFSSYWCETCEHIIRKTYDMYDLEFILPGQVKEEDEELWESTKKMIDEKNQVNN